MNFESEKSSSKRSESDETDQNHHKKIESPLVHENIMMNEESRERSPVQMLEESLEINENGYGTEREGESRTKDD